MKENVGNNQVGFEEKDVGETAFSPEPVIADSPSSTLKPAITRATEPIIEK